MPRFKKLTVKEIIKETENAVSIAFNIPNELKDEFKFYIRHKLEKKSDLHYENKKIQN